MKRKRKRKRKYCTAKLRTWADPILTQVCEPVGDEDISHIIRDMFFVLTNSKKGVGISAPQVGHLKRVVIVGHLVMINPVLIETGKEQETKEEGCLSYPGRFLPVERWKRVGIEYVSESGAKISDWLWKETARVFQHELDHLDGKCALRLNTAVA